MLAKLKNLIEWVGALALLALAYLGLRKKQMTAEDTQAEIAAALRAQLLTEEAKKNDENALRLQSGYTSLRDEYLSEHPGELPAGDSSGGSGTGSEGHGS